LSVTCSMSVVSPGTPVSSTDKSDQHDITETLLKITLTPLALKSDWTILIVCFLYREQLQQQHGEFMATRRQLSQNNRENEKLTRECEELTNRQQVSYASIYFSWKWRHPCPVHCFYGQQFHQYKK
jgi:hypothetical protein